MEGYTYTKPLLACDTLPTGVHSSQMETVKKTVEEEINEAVQRGDVTHVSVYVRDLVNRQEVSINGDEKFFPASLKKVPLMMAYFKAAETSPQFFQQEVEITDPTDYNATAVIKPKEFPVFGHKYTNAELINFMIRHSDNTSFQVLLRNMGTEDFNQAYADLQLHYPDNIVSINDYMTTYQFSLFFRTLFNATYLNHDNSEAALALLAGAEYKNGIVAGIPSGTPVAHKFGVGAVSQADGTLQGELHDCGIIYRTDNPYLLCVMTKSKSLDMSAVEKTIAAISNTVYSNLK
ncbi:MAG: serine hydrolase [Candidatus Paceibacterota bacterium]